MSKSQTGEMMEICVRTFLPNTLFYEFQIKLKQRPAHIFKILLLVIFTDKRLSNFTVAVGTTLFLNPYVSGGYLLCTNVEGPLGDGETRVLHCNQVTTGRFVSIYLNQVGYLTLCEVEVYAGGNVMQMNLWKSNRNKEQLRSKKHLFITENVEVTTLVERKTDEAVTIQSTFGLLFSIYLHTVRFWYLQQTYLCASFVFRRALLWGWESIQHHVNPSQLHRRSERVLLMNKSCSFPSKQVTDSEHISFAHLPDQPTKLEGILYF